jgi:hypothetical protein
LQLLTDAHRRRNLPAGVEFIASIEPGGDQSGHDSIPSGQSPGPSSSRTTRHASPSG